MMVGRDLSSFYKKEHDAESRGRVSVLACVDMADGAARPGLLASTSIRARCSGSPALSAPGAPSLPASSIGADAATPGPSSSTASRSTSARPARRIEAGIVYLTEDRKPLGLFLDMTCRENINLAVLGRDAGSAASSIATRRASAPRGNPGARHPGRRRPRARRRPLRRQSAEGAARRAFSRPSPRS